MTFGHNLRSIQIVEEAEVELSTPLILPRL